MIRSRRLLLSVCSAAACALAAPAALGAPHAASSGRGVVLSVGHHGVRLVDGAHRVADVRVRSVRGLRRGDVVTVRGGRARVAGHRGRVAFLARVVRSGRRGTVLRLGDGSTFNLKSRRDGSRSGGGRRGRSASATVTIDLQGLQPGQTLLIAIATGDGNLALTIRLLPASTDIGDGRQGDEGDDCDLAAASQADDGDQADEGDDGDEADEPADGCRADDEVDEVDGVVTALAGDGSSLTLAPDDGRDELTIPVDDPELLDGIAVGDDVAVILDEDGTAIDVELLDLADEDASDDDA